MIYELRIYHAVPGRLPALLARFQNRTLPIWEKHGIRQAGFWTTLIGESNQQLTYMLAWDSLAVPQDQHHRHVGRDQRRDRERRPTRSKHQQRVAGADCVFLSEVNGGGLPKDFLMRLAFI